MPLVTLEHGVGTKAPPQCHVHVLRLKSGEEFVFNDYDSDPFDCHPCEISGATAIAMIAERTTVWRISYEAEDPDDTRLYWAAKTKASRREIRDIRTMYAYMVAQHAPS